MLKLEDTWEKNIENIENNIDLLILYLSIANNPKCSKEARKVFDQMIETYCNENKTSLKEIAENNGHKIKDDPMRVKKNESNKEDLWRLEIIRAFNGILIDGTVKPIKKNENKLNDFSDGDPVVVMHRDDFKELLDGKQKLLEILIDVKKEFSSLK